MPVITATDLRAFEAVAGATGLKLDHPATLALRLERRDVLSAHEFAGELNLALAERGLAAAQAASLGGAPRPDRLTAPAPDAARTVARPAADEPMA